MTSEEVLRGHMRTHMMGASGGIAAFERVASTHGIPEVRSMLTEMTEEIRRDQQELRGLMEAAGVTMSGPGTVMTRASDVIARFKPTGRLIGRSALVDVLDVEALYAAVATKRNGWRFMRHAARSGAPLDVELLDELEERADSQLERLQEMHALASLGRLAS